VVQRRSTSGWRGSIVVRGRRIGGRRPNLGLDILPADLSGLLVQSRRRKILHLGPGANSLRKGREPGSRFDFGKPVGDALGEGFGSEFELAGGFHESCVEVEVESLKEEEGDETGDDEGRD
jgi:hypothetical protein